MNSVIFKDPESGTEARVEYRASSAGDGMIVSVTDVTTNRALGNVFVSAPKPKTHEVGVVLNAAVVKSNSAKIHTYDALSKLDLEIGDQVLCPWGYHSGKDLGDTMGTVVTLDPAKSSHTTRTITWKRT